MSNKSEQALNVMENYIHDLDRDDAKYVLGLLVDMIMTSGERDDKCGQCGMTLEEDMVLQRDGGYLCQDCDESLEEL